ncbi:hypothetical protein QCA50_019415 [Cerrena zonata]|uniref:Uncharacterized protein n=1 Tax=Cerrena zonata TaxID=2478898 RepID=A0AAW0FHK1_9APHY
MASSRNCATPSLKTRKHSSTKPKKVPKTAASLSRATRATPSLDDPAFVPMFDRPFVIYGLNNEPYIVNARPCHNTREVSPHPDDASPSLTGSTDGDEAYDQAYNEGQSNGNEICSQTSNENVPSDHSSLRPSTEVDLASYCRGIEVGKMMAHSGSSVGPNLARNRRRRAAKKLKKQQDAMHQT